MFSQSQYSTASPTAEKRCVCVEAERKMPVICGAVVWVKQLAKLLHSALGLLVTDVCLYYLINDEPLDKLLLHSFTASSSS